ncbi:MAG: DUF423 domain-containing protein [Planctomycetota bacterium]
MSRNVLIAAGITGAVGVAIGAFGAHGLDAMLAARGYEVELIERRLGQFDVGVRYHLIHSVALLALASASGHAECLRWATRLFVAGLFLFSGSLYLLVLTNTTWLGAITPLGGLTWIFAWICLAFSARQSE